MNRESLSRSVRDDHSRGAITTDERDALLSAIANETIDTASKIVSEHRKGRA